MLKDCTEEFIRYREVCRNVWNAGFRHNAKIEIGVDHSIFYQFREIEARLFEGMVLLPLGITEPVRDRNRLSVDFSFYVTTSPNERERKTLAGGTFTGSHCNPTPTNSAFTNFSTGTSWVRATINMSWSSWKP
jgi:hypothetical protein